MAQKRAPPIEESTAAPLKDRQHPEQNAAQQQEEDLDFEDEYEDEYESEDDEILEAGVDGRPDEEREAEEKEAMDVDQKTFIPGRHRLSAGETLSPDLSTYDMLHSLSTNWPCLSFDIVKDMLGDNRKSYPATLYAVAGTQADGARSKENEIMVMKLSGLSRMEREGEGSESEDDSDEDEAADPILETKSIPLNTCTNRIRAHQLPQQNSSTPPTTLTATMTESATVLIHDITPHLRSFDTPGFSVTQQHNRPLSSLRCHRSEGYALDWSPLFPLGKLLTGDNDGNIHLTTRAEGGGFSTDTRPFTGHAGSVEELQWSPSERNVFASASSDGSVKIWDTRSKSRTAALTVPISQTDVNVLSWSRLQSHLLASGADDGQWAVWDLRNWKSSNKNNTSTNSSGGGGSGSGRDATLPPSTPVASYNFHKEQITSIEWHPTDDSVMAVAAADNTVTLWDLAVELDDEESRFTADAKDVPPQLLFVHYMDQVKELHWHPQIQSAIVATGGTGFGVFKTISV